MCKVLLVEDEKRITDSLSEILRNHQFDVLVANSGEEALAISAIDKPDVVVTDLMMPGMDGHELLKKFRSAISKDTPFIVITAKSGYADIRLAMDEGFDDYITKPFKTIELINSINKRIERKSEFNRPLEDKISRFANAIKLITNHEFNTPMTAIKGFADLISHHDYDIRKEDLKQYVEYINGGADRLITLFNRLRFWQQLERDSIKCTRELILIDELFIENILKKVNKYNLRSADVIFNVSASTLFTYKVFIENILYEIFDNAIKFSKPGTPVQIEVTQANQEVIFNVANENGYVTIEQLYEYELFQQFNREEQEQQGLGVGLAIIKLITHYVDAKLNFEKDLNTINVKINLNSYDE
jgi:CheY-like chemotaxis protein